MASTKLLVLCVVVCLELQQGQAQGDAFKHVTHHLFVQCKDMYNELYTFWFHVHACAWINCLQFCRGLYSSEATSKYSSEATSEYSYL